ncbi:uncharacterized protein [Triticum aestivum]|uniref:uncharacterized protein n=1 Tax=Triticum aestivum TaxID=4565 RepID=UPI001D012BBD|nr:uncharacterized protein LOC123182534 [Triticum aestivum]
MKVLRESTWDAAAAQRRAQRARRRRQAATWKARRGMPGPPRFLDRCDTLHDGRPKILRPQEASGGSGASPAKSGQIQWKNNPPARPSDQAPIAEPNGRHAADAVQPSLCFHIASYGIESVFKGFLFLILVHASTEISNYIWSILVFFLMSFTIHQVPLSPGSQVVLAITTCVAKVQWTANLATC